MRAIKPSAKRLSVRPPSGSVIPHVQTFTSQLYRKVKGHYRRADDSLVVTSALKILAGRVALGPKITGIKAVRDYLAVRLGGLEYEVFCCLYLDAGHRVIACEDLFRGSLGMAYVHLREVAKQALLHNARSLIVAHNHPSGRAEINKHDRNLTVRLQATLELIDVLLIDHLIIGAGEVASMNERGFI